MQKNGVCWKSLPLNCPSYCFAAVQDESFKCIDILDLGLLVPQISGYSDFGLYSDYTSGLQTLGVLCQVLEQHVRWGTSLWITRYRASRFASATKFLRCRFFHWWKNRQRRAFVAEANRYGYRGPWVSTYMFWQPMGIWFTIDYITGG